MSEFVLEMRDVCKSFPGVKALDHAQLKLRPGKVHALMGENGAGKSTLMKCMFGIYTMDEGEIYIDGEKTAIRDPLEAWDKGISMVHQELQPIPARTIGENIFLGRYPMKKALGFIPIVDHEKMYEETAKLLTQNEVEALFRIVEDLKKENVAVVYISHKMDEILRISDEVTIMRDGQYIGTWDARDLTTDFIITKMVGRELTNLYPKRENVPGDVVFEVEDFTSINPRSFRHVSFNLRKGEILGVAGLVGAQRTELMEGLFGTRSHTSGTIKYQGRELHIRRPKDAIDQGIAMLTEDRRGSGIMGVLSVADNISIASLNKYVDHGFVLNTKKINDLVEENRQKMNIKTPSGKTLIKSLSGGNHEPTRGIDVGAKYEIYCIIADLAKQGKSIIMISSEMGELIGMSDRIMVMCDGRMTGVIDGKDANQENIMALATQFE